MKIVILFEELNELECAELKQTVERAGGDATLIFKKFSTKAISHLQDLHGNYMTYARLFLGQLLEEMDRVIYLDSDLIVNCSLMELWSMSMNGNVIGAVSDCEVEWCFEKEFLKGLGIPGNAFYLNGGVMLMDLKAWREQGTTERSVQFLVQHKGECRTADQTVLNALFSQKHLKLPSIFNIPVYPEKPALKPTPSGVLHLLGGPKPWDVWGRFLHGSSDLYYEILNKTAYRKRFIHGSLSRLYHLRRSYCRLIQAKLKQRFPASALC